VPDCVKGTINAVCLVKDAIRCHGNLSTNVSITPAMVRHAQGVYSKYKEQLEEEQRIKEMRKKQLLERKQWQLEEEKKKKRRKN